MELSAVCHQGTLPGTRVTNQRQQTRGLGSTIDVVVYLLDLAVPTKQYLIVKQRRHSKVTS